MAARRDAVGTLTLADRVRAYRQAFPTNRASWPYIVREQGKPVIYGTWLIGQDYRAKSRFYGSYPPGYLNRVLTLFPDVPPFNQDEGRLTTLHVFSGSLGDGIYVRCDSVQPAEIAGAA